ncbi:hypothetical protein [Saccharomonospora sp. CUA-673]|uniref:hypothetical protein n=1 Tax=Saccharomonospora sp. CUA-673 TaxID=1904969 RepID=UPI0011152166|nr:hypothetical protein [Saccharomonospora sp. CUA-673]
MSEQAHHDRFLSSERNCGNVPLLEPINGYPTPMGRTRVLRVPELGASVGARVLARFFRYA